MTGWPSITSVPLYFTGGPGGAFKGYVYRKHRHVFFEKCRRSCLVTNSLSLISEEEMAAGGGGPRPRPSCQSPHPGETIRVSPEGNYVHIVVCVDRGKKGLKKDAAQLLLEVERRGRGLV